jgi:polysaccharide biosynthesis protein PslG
MDRGASRRILGPAPLRSTQARLAAILARRLFSTLVTSLVAVAVLTASSPAARARVPQGFVGMNGDSPLFDQSINLGRQLGAMVSSGVESLRVAFDWSAAQPYKRWSDVPAAQSANFVNVGGIPTDFAATDQLVALTAHRGLQVLPTVLYAPPWDAARHPPDELAPPKSDAPYADFVKALVRRYGPHGTFWQANATIPYRPIRMWQIWNEPDIPTFWPPRPFAPSYVALLRAAHAAIKSVDPGAKVVLAGLPNFSWLYLQDIYKLHAGDDFDLVAIHPYTAEPQGVITILGNVRSVMNAAGDRRKPILVTEFGWASVNGGQDWDTTPAGQATRLATLLPLLASNRTRLGLGGFYYFTWVSEETPGTSWSHFSGLFRFSNNALRAKPAFFAFRTAALALEGCRQKGVLATSCARRG